MKALISLLIVFLVTGCSTLGNRTSVITAPNGEQYKVESQRNARVLYDDGKTMVEVDNRGGGSSTLETLKDLMLIKAVKDNE